MFENKLKTAVDKFRGSVSSALALDWVQLIGMLAEVLLPLLQNCFSPDQAAKRMKKLGFVDKTRLRVALRRRLQDEDSLMGERLRPHVSKLMESLVDVSQESTEEELQQVYEEAVTA